VCSITRRTSAHTLPVIRMLEQGQCTHASPKISPRNWRVYELDVVIPRVEELAAHTLYTSPRTKQVENIVEVLCWSDAKNSGKALQDWTKNASGYDFPRTTFSSHGSVRVARVKGGCKFNYINQQSINYHRQCLEGILTLRSVKCHFAPDTGGWGNTVYTSICAFDEQSQ
jgi:hypothetical protein